jgi:hypothetical protein
LALSIAASSFDLQPANITSASIIAAAAFPEFPEFFNFIVESSFFVRFPLLDSSRSGPTAPS